MKKFINVIISLGIIFLLAVSVQAEERDWESAYRTAIKENAKDYGGVLQLVDLDVDGTPELLIGSPGGSGGFSTCDLAFTYRDDKLQQIYIMDEYMMISLNGYTLYQNETNKDVRIEGKYSVRAGAGNYAVMECVLYSLTDKIYYDIIFHNEVINGGEPKYFYDNEDFKNQPMTVAPDGSTSELVYLEEMRKYHEGWKLIEEYQPVGEYFSKKPTSSEIDALFDSYKDGPALAYKSKHNVKVNRDEVKPAGYNIGGNNYYKLRDIAKLLDGTEAKFNVTWDGEAIRIKTETNYSPVGGELSADSLYEKNLTMPYGDQIYINDVPVKLKAYNIDGNNYFQLRDLGKKLGFGVQWLGNSETVVMLTEDKLAAEINPSADSFYYTSANLLSRGQCTWYAYGRFWELTGIKLNSMRDAGESWISDNLNDSRLVVTQDISGLAPLSIMVTDHHVAIIEAIDYDENGNPVTIYLTESNMDKNGQYDEGVDCLVKVLSYDKILSRKPLGFIRAAN